jgi:hypothetical protein
MKRIGIAKKSIANAVAHPRKPTVYYKLEGGGWSAGPNLGF